MKKAIICFALLSAGFFFVQACGESAATKTAVDSNANGGVTPATVSASVNGKVLYEEKCTTCHGGDGKQGIMGASDLSTSTIDHTTVTNVIKMGRNNMKAFGPEMNDEQIEEVAKYVESLRK